MYRSQVLEAVTDKDLSEPTVGTRLDSVATTDDGRSQGLGIHRTVVGISLTLYEAGSGAPLTDIP